MHQPMIVRATNVHRTVRSGMAVYRMTPRSLRRPEPAARAAVGGLGAWFAVLFGALGVGLADARYLLVAAVGALAVGFAASRQLRAAAGCLAGMLVAGQVIALSGLAA
jgi:hypothetical protein